MKNMKMNHAQSGFTLIELMIVIAIIGILAAIAIPQYQDYIARSQVTRVVGESGSLKTSVEQCVLNGSTKVGKVDKTNPNNCDPGATGSNLIDSTAGASQVGATLPANTGVPQVTLNSDGTATIVATFGSNASSILTSKGGLITWTRSIDGSWSCNATKIDAKYAASGCPLS